MRIGELSKHSGLSIHTIRFYEKQGLVEAQPSASPYNNYKDYPAANLERLQQIRRIQSFGFTLAEVAALLERIGDGTASCDHVSERLKEKTNLIDARIRELTLLKSYISEQADRCCGATAGQNCPLVR